ncbi:MAG: hypothetical protein KKH47_12260 [Proteobacteria bacterium]|nr:hypothetical protein [Pseudomonadota bacterium]
MDCISIQSDSQRIALHNRCGVMRVALSGGQMSFQPNWLPARDALQGRPGLHGPGGRWRSGSGPVAHGPARPRLGPENQAWSFSQALSGRDGRLHWHLEAGEDYFALTAGASQCSSPLGRLVSYSLEAAPSQPQETGGPVRMLCLAYCSAHTGSPLSQTHLLALDSHSQADSWWATALIWPGGPGVVLGYLSAQRLVGKMELRQGRLDCLNFADGASASGEDILWSEPLFISCAPEVTAALARYARKAAAHLGVRPRFQPVCGWGSWGRFHEQIDEDLIRVNAARLAEESFGGRFEKLLEIDHGWEERLAVHRPECTWQPRKEFSGDMPALVKQLKADGLRVGLWVTPFVINASSADYHKYEPCLVRGTDGRPRRVGGKGGAFCIDPTHPVGEEYLRALFRRLCGWGVRYFKLDFLRCLLAPEPDDPQDGLDQPRLHHGGINRVEAYRRGLGIIRDTVGEEVYLLSCGGPTLPGAGLIDAQRIGQDIGYAWDDGHTGIRDCSRNLALNFFWHGRLWHNDPDFLILPPEGRLRRFWSTAVSLSGGSKLISADLTGLSPERWDELAAMLPSWGESAWPLDWDASGRPRLWRLTLEAHGESYFVVGLFNWDDVPRDLELSLPQVLGADSTDGFAAFEYWGRRYMGESTRGWTLEVPARDVALVCLRKVLPRPQLIATSLHFTMGAVDLSRSSWQAEEGRLSLATSGLGRGRGRIFVRVPPAYQGPGQAVPADGLSTLAISGPGRQEINLDFQSQKRDAP